MKSRRDTTLYISPASYCFNLFNNTEIFSMMNMIISEANTNPFNGKNSIVIRTAMAILLEDRTNLDIASFCIRNMISIKILKESNAALRSVCIQPSPPATVLHQNIPITVVMI